MDDSTLLVYHECSTTAPAFRHSYHHYKTSVSQTRQRDVIGQDELAFITHQGMPTMAANVDCLKYFKMIHILCTLIDVNVNIQSILYGFDRLSNGKS